MNDDSPMIADPLPALPSALLRHALADLAKAEADPGYQIDMNVWHVPYTGRHLVDLAGAVMAFSLDAPRGVTLTPRDFPADLRAKLEAIDDLQRGAVWRALERLDLLTDERLAAGAHCLRTGSPDDAVTITLYREDPARFRTDLEGLAARLERDGL